MTHACVTAGSRVQRLVAKTVYVERETALVVGRRQRLARHPYRQQSTS